jgi:histidinol dehydrogenase
MKNHLKKVDPDKWDKIVQRMKDKERKHNTMDKNVEKVITQLRDREEEGLRKYGVNTERTDLTSLEWLQHLQEELMDASVYIEKLKSEMKETQAEMSGMKWKD